ncbi:leukocyte immunoglobulin-like receptor subfamily B member 3 [Nannospalax galili]|uniref:leukocyte immunoglobulin-like receptor subfamily B member 3 n=1 Tax=Nannospalax galili TaxID=1026970 RepID=UPI00111C6BC3|nr:leukocyte immunoglobulin-like receptor subfamily B member 3 [Nannospalax galili]
MSSGSASDFLSGTPKKPILWAEPGSLIPRMGSVTIWCEGTLATRAYRLYTERHSRSWCKPAEENLRNKAKFTIPIVTEQEADVYHCIYRSSAGWSADSDPLELVVTGVYSKPSLSVLSSPVVTLGESRKLQCTSQQRSGSFILVKGENGGFSRTRSSQFPQGRVQAVLLLGPITLSHAGTYRCYTFDRNTPQVWSTPSDPLELLVSGMSKRPSLLTQQGSVLAPGEKLTLQCFSDTKYGRFIVVKDGERDLRQHLDKKPQAVDSQADFPLGPVNSSHGGRYRCYGAHNVSSELSAPSDPLDILITGQIPITPSLSVQPGPMVSTGENVTLLCQSQNQVGSFLLVKEGAAQPQLCLKPTRQAGQFQAEFFISAVTADVMGTYRCYGSGGSSPYLLSHASDPLNLVASATPSLSATLVLLLGDYSWKAAFGVDSQEHQTLSAPPDATVSAGLSVMKQLRKPCRCPAVRSEGQGRQSPKDEGPLEVVYAHVKVSRKRHKEASCSSFPLEQFCDMKTRPSGEEGQTGSQGVTYALQNVSKARQRTTTPPSSWEEEPSAKSTLCTAFITHQNRTSLRPQAARAETLFYIFINSQTWIHNGREGMTGLQERTAGCSDFHCTQETVGRGTRLEALKVPQRHNFSRLILELRNPVLAGIYPKPRLSVLLLSPVVTSGENLTLQCGSQKGYDRFTLTKEDQKFYRCLDSQYIYSPGQFQALFLVDPLTPGHRGMFRCYGYYRRNPQVWSEPSNVLEVHISGLSRNPSLLTLHGPILTIGENLVLQCCSEIYYKKFALSKEGRTHLIQHSGQGTQTGLSQASFSLGSVNVSCGGQYRCYGIHNLSSEWSAPSNPLDILITGQFPVTPSLSVKPGPTLFSGKNVILLCQSESRMDTFLLTKEGAANHILHLMSRFQAGKYWAEFSVTSALSGIYRCYGSQSSSPHLLSLPSAPVELASGLESYQNFLIIALVTFLLLLFLLLFFSIILFFLRLRHENRRGKEDASVKIPQPEDSVELDSLTPIKEMYAQVKPSRIRRSGNTSPSTMPRDTQAEEDRERDNQAAASEEPQDVAYPLHVYG